MVRIPFEISDDYRVVQATIMVRNANNRQYKEYPLEHVMDVTYSFQG